MISSHLGHVRFSLLRPSFLALLTVAVLCSVLGNGIFAQESDACIITAPQNANIREEALVTSNRLGTLGAGESAQAVAQILDGDNYIWWKLDREGWIRSDVVEENTYCSQLPDATAITDPTREPLENAQPTEQPTSIGTTSEFQLGEDYTSADFSLGFSYPTDWSATEDSENITLISGPDSAFGSVMMIFADPDGLELTVEQFPDPTLAMNFIAGIFGTQDEVMMGEVSAINIRNRPGASMLMRDTDAGTDNQLYLVALADGRYTLVFGASLDRDYEDVRSIVETILATLDTVNAAQPLPPTPIPEVVQSATEDIPTLTAIPQTTPTPETPQDEDVRDSTEAQDPIQLALSHLDQGRYSEALEALDLALEIDSDMETVVEAYRIVVEQTQIIEEFVGEPTAQNYFTRGEAFMELNYVNLALEDFTLAIELDPDDAGLFNKRGLAYQEAGNYELAISDYDQAIALDSELVVAYSRRSLANIVLSNLEEAVADVNRALELDPDNPEAYFARGQIHVLEGDSEEALDDFAEALRTVPLLNTLDRVFRGELLYGKIYYLRAEVYERQDETDAAFDDFTRAGDHYSNGRRFAIASIAYGRATEVDPERAIERWTLVIQSNPQAANAFASRGFAYMALDDHVKAIQDYDRAIELDAEYVNAYSNRGSAYSELGESEMAIESYSQAILIDPTYVNAYTGRGNVYRIQGEYEQAIKDFDQAILLDPTYLFAFNGRGNAYYEQGEYERAIEDYNQAILLDPAYVLVYSSRGNVYYAQGEYERAIEDFDQAILLDPKNVNAYNSRGFAFRNLGEHEKAIADFDRAIERDPNYALPYFGRGSAHYLLESYQATIEDMSQYIDLLPEDRYAYDWRGHAYFYLEEFELALADLREYQRLAGDTTEDHILETIATLEDRLGLTQD